MSGNKQRNRKLLLNLAKNPSEKSIKDRKRNAQSHEGCCTKKDKRISKTKQNIACNIWTDTNAHFVASRYLSSKTILKNVAKATLKNTKIQKISLKKDQQAQNR